MTIFATFGKAMLYKTPNGDGFGLVSLPAGFAGATKTCLYGASLSGKLDKAVTIGFEIVRQSPDNKYKHVEVYLRPERGGDQLLRGRKHA